MVAIMTIVGCTILFYLLQRRRGMSRVGASDIETVQSQQELQQTEKKLLSPTSARSNRQESEVGLTDRDLLPNEATARRVKEEP